MKRTYPPLYVVATCVGILCIITDVASNIEFGLEQTGTLFDSTIIAIVAVASGTVIALSCAMAALRACHIVLTIMLSLGFLLGAAFSLSATLDRVATQRDNKLTSVWSKDLEIQELFKRKAWIVRAATDECRKTSRRYPDGNGPACQSIRGEIPLIDMQIQVRKAHLDSLGRRISAMTAGHVTIEQASLYQPCILPVALFILGNWLVAFGLNGRMIKPEFEIKLTGRAELEAKAERYADAFQAQKGRLPKPSELEEVLGVSTAVARRLHRDLQVA